MPSATTQPWTPTVKPLKTGLGDLSSLYGSGGLRRTYGPNRTAGLNSTLSGAWDATAQRASQGGSLLPQSKDYYSKVLNGDFLGREAPGFSDVLGKTRDLVNANASANSQYGSGVHQGALTRELGGLEFANYQNERDYMDRAAGIAPEMDAADYFDLDRMTQVGSQRQGYDQLLADEASGRHQFEEGAPEDAIARYLSYLSSIGGLGSINSGPGQQQPNVNPWLIGAGAATDLAGSAVGSNGFWDLF